LATENVILPGRGYKIARTTAGTVLEIDFNGSGLSGVAKQYVIKSVQGDYLTCRAVSLDSAGVRTEGATDFFIAKNYQLRNSLASEVVDGTTITYTYPTTTDRHAVSGSDTEDQKIVPRYVVDSIIYAVQTRTGVYKDSVEIELLDINADARAWSMVE
jgi:hypothetical protein